MPISGRNRRRNRENVDLENLPEFMDSETEKKVEIASNPNRDIEEAPIEVQEYLAQANVPNEFQFFIYKKLTNGKKALQAKLISETLDENEIGKRYGSGEYDCQLQWRYLGSENEVKKGSKWFSMFLGPEFDVVHSQYRRENLLNMGIVGNPSQGQPIDHIQTIKALAEMLPKPVEQKSSLGEIAGLIAAFAPMVMKIMDDSAKRRDEADKRMEKILEKLATPKEDDFMKTIQMIKTMKEVFPEPEVRPEGGDKIDRVIDGAIELIRTMGPQLIQKANAPVIGGFVRQQISNDERWMQILSDPEQRELAITELYATNPKSEVDKFLTGMNVPQFIRHELTGNG